jgi:hypothetical protein
MKTPSAHEQSQIVRWVTAIMAGLVIWGGSELVETSDTQIALFTNQKNEIQRSKGIDEQQKEDIEGLDKRVTILEARERVAYRTLGEILTALKFLHKGEKIGSYSRPEDSNNH